MQSFRTNCQLRQLGGFPQQFFLTPPSCSFPIDLIWNVSAGQRSVLYARLIVFARTCQITQVTQGANCSIRSFPPPQQREEGRGKRRGERAGGSQEEEARKEDEDEEEEEEVPHSRTPNFRLVCFFFLYPPAPGADFFII